MYDVLATAFWKSSEVDGMVFLKVSDSYRETFCNVKERDCEKSYWVSRVKLKVLTRRFCGLSPPQSHYRFKKNNRKVL